jgi:DNA-binding LacI/PurR family transcriptional regulator
MVTATVDLLFELIEGGGDGPIRIEIESELVIRGSTRSQASIAATEHDRKITRL